MLNPPHRTLNCSQWMRTEAKSLTLMLDGITYSWLPFVLLSGERSTEPFVAFLPFAFDISFFERKTFRSGPPQVLKLFLKETIVLPFSCFTSQLPWMVFCLLTHDPWLTEFANEFPVTRNAARRSASIAMLLKVFADVVVLIILISIVFKLYC